MCIVDQIKSIGSVLDHRFLIWLIDVFSKWENSKAEMNKISMKVKNKNVNKKGNKIDFERNENVKNSEFRSFIYS